MKSPDPSMSSPTNNGTEAVSSADSSGSTISIPPKSSKSFLLSGQWSSLEDITILKQVLAHGHSWAKICRESLSHRTEHMVKNRFKSLLLHHSSDIAKPNYN